MRVDCCVSSIELPHPDFVCPRDRGGISESLPTGSPKASYLCYLAQQVSHAIYRDERKVIKGNIVVSNEVPVKGDLVAGI